MPTNFVASYKPELGIRRGIDIAAHQQSSCKESAVCADCNDPITGCSSRSVIVTCRRPIAKRITGLRRHADEQLNGGQD
jgi:hypothetical protein